MSSYNLAQRIYIDDDGSLCAITNVYDADGEDTDDCELARVVVVRRSANEWFAVRVNEPDDVKLRIG